ncbi:TPR repeat-containing [Fusarium albosuccineum]|uniref:TPR repeat-containing n=1 Tax=Fusarium albosuccineum TaxID=1237068 RepID=A0A8H4KZZ8_9HYPO|nr:TPR repeat-containing [Fusarium albosuccineum]
MDNARACGSALRAGHFGSILVSSKTPDSSPGSTSDSVPAPAPVAGALIQAFAARLAASTSVAAPDATVPSTDVAQVLSVGLAALNAFLQVNVTGPILPESAALSTLLTKAWADAQSDSTNATRDHLHRACLRDLEVDGVSPYAYIPHLELFALAKHIIAQSLSHVTSDVVEIPSDQESLKYSLIWSRLRVNVWHYKLLTQPSLGPGSNFTRSSQWSDVPTLASQILDGIDAARSQVLGEEVWASDDDTWGRDDKAQFLVEAANNYILLGRDDKAREALKEAAQTSGFAYALSGALGKRTKFQEKSISQLVVLAKSGAQQQADDGDEEAKPDALQLNDDTLLEEIEFNKEENGNDTKDTLPTVLVDLAPDDQPQLSPLDQIILLTEATLKDAFSPLDTLTSAEVLPYAVRVIGDKSTNWQIYTQALLVRSRIEVHRSRTVERGVLQMQAVADQVLTDTTAEVKQVEETKKESAVTDAAPVIEVTTPDQATASVQSKPTSFLPAPKASESAPAHVRLQYIHALSSPPRWHLESELAYAWVGVGSLASALEIFKRLRLWAEVALCLASAASSDDEDGRGSGGDEKAKGIIRWRLFHRTGDATSPSDPDKEDIGEDITLLKASDFSGPERDPPPPNAPRLFCILGEIEDEPVHYERAWEISKHRYARAQKSLGEYYLQQKDAEKARDAYKKATAVNRLDPDMWSRLGDISLRLAQFGDAAEAFNRSIGCASDTAGGEDARTWSNLGSALWSLYCEVSAETKDKGAPTEEVPTRAPADDEEDDVVAAAASKPSDRDPATLLAQSLAAYKKGASIAHDNWRIWDNVLTLASRMHPPALPDMILALKHIIRIRHSEDALDVDVLAALLQDAVLSVEKTTSSGVYDPPRGSPERLVMRLFEEEMVPIITQRSELWALVSRLRAWRRDYEGAIDAAERAWRAAVGSSGSGLLPGAAATTADEERDWTTNESAWTVVVQRTDELVSVLENWGPDVESIGTRWKGKARSAVRSVMGKGRERWEGSEGWKVLEGLMEGLKISR